MQQCNKSICSTKKQYIVAYMDRSKKVSTENLADQVTEIYNSVSDYQ